MAAEEDARRRVLVISDYGWSTGGVEQFVCEFLSRTQSHYRTRLLTWSPADPPVPRGFTEVIGTQFGDIRPAWAAMDWAQTTVVVTSFNVRLLARLVADRPAGADDLVCVVQTSGHSDPSASATPVQEAWLSTLIRRSRATVAASVDLRAALHGLAGGNGVLVIENAARLDAGAAVQRPRGRSVVGFIGRPHPQKGWPLFTRLARDLAGNGLTFVANTVSVPASDAPSNVSVTWGLDDEALIRFFETCDVLVTPYLRADGLPLAVLEALNCGVPVVGFETPGLAHLLRRHGQAVVSPEYASLRDAVLAWAQGRLPLAAPPAGSIAGWDEQIAQYTQVIGVGGT